MKSNNKLIIHLTAITSSVIAITLCCCLLTTIIYSADNYFDEVKQTIMYQVEPFGFITLMAFYSFTLILIFVFIKVIGEPLIEVMVYGIEGIIKEQKK